MPATPRQTPRQKIYERDQLFKELSSYGYNKPVTRKVDQGQNRFLEYHLRNNSDDAARPYILITDPGGVPTDASLQGLRNLTKNMRERAAIAADPYARAVEIDEAAVSSVASAAVNGQQAPADETPAHAGKPACENMAPPLALVVNQPAPPAAQTTHPPATPISHPHAPLTEERNPMPATTARAIEHVPAAAPETLDAMLAHPEEKLNGKIQQGRIKLKLTHGQLATLTTKAMVGGGEVTADQVMDWEQGTQVPARAEFKALAEILVYKNTAITDKGDAFTQATFDAFEKAYNEALAADVGSAERKTFGKLIMQHHDDLSNVEYHSFKKLAEAVSKNIRIELSTAEQKAFDKGQGAEVIMAIERGDYNEVSKGLQLAITKALDTAYALSEGQKSELHNAAEVARQAANGTTPPVTHAANISRRAAPIESQEEVDINALRHAAIARLTNANGGEVPSAKIISDALKPTRGADIPPRVRGQINAFLDTENTGEYGLKAKHALSDAVRDALTAFLEIKNVSKNARSHFTKDFITLQQAAGNNSEMAAERA